MRWWNLVPWRRGACRADEYRLVSQSGRRAGSTVKRPEKGFRRADGSCMVEGDAA